MVLRERGGWRERKREGGEEGEGEEQGREGEIERGKPILRDLCPVQSLYFLLLDYTQNFLCPIGWYSTSEDIKKLDDSFQCSKILNKGFSQ